MKRFAVLLAFVCVVAGSPDAYGGWGGGGCASVDAARIAPAEPFNGWTKVTADEQAYYVAGKHVASWNSARGEYRKIVNGQWQAPSAPPWQVETVAANFGVDTSRLNGTASPRYYRNGAEVSRDEAYDITGADLPDDTKKMRLTVVSRDAALLKTVAASTSHLRDKFVVQAYPADHWAVKPFKLESDPQFVANGGFVAVVQAAPDAKGAGVVLDTMYSMEAVRKIDPTYDPAKVTPNKDTDMLAIILKHVVDVPPDVWIGAGVVVAVLILRKRSQ